jgi:dihydroneopterin aldolase/2-amino-4-hydroxy-6-hydroxymethyldihydropteridine diphosphokinase
VERQLFWHKAYLSMGSNIGDKRSYLQHALEALDAQKHTRLIRQSSFILTEPYGGVEQDDFLNNAVMIQTLLSPENLLAFLHEIENEAGRTREVRWGPRTLDIDILFYDDLIYESGTLVIPHVDLENRTFVLEPLSEIAPNHRHPVYLKTVSQLLKELKQKV